MDNATAPTSRYCSQQTKPTLRAYQFVVTPVEQHDPLRLDIDCENDMEASIVALGLVSREHAVDVWSDGTLIYKAPAIGTTQIAIDTPEPVRPRQCVYSAGLAIQSVQASPFSVPVALEFQTDSP